MFRKKSLSSWALSGNFEGKNFKISFNEETGPKPVYLPPADNTGSIINIILNPIWTTSKLKAHTANWV